MNLYHHEPSCITYVDTNNVNHIQNKHNPVKNIIIFFTLKSKNRKNNIFTSKALQIYIGLFFYSFEFYYLNKT